MRTWLLNNKLFGPYLYNYINFKAVPLKAKIVSIGLLWITMTISVCLVDILWLRILLLCIAVAVTIHLLMIKTLK